MDFKIELEKVLAQYKKHHGDGRKCDYVIFFQEYAGDDIDHLLCFEQQIPAVQDYVKWYKPHFVSINPFGSPVYDYFRPAEERK